MGPSPKASCFIKKLLDIVEVPEYNGLAYELEILPFPIIIHFIRQRSWSFFQRAENYQRLKQWHLFEVKQSNAFAFRCPSAALKMEICNRYAIPETK